MAERSVAGLGPRVGERLAGLRDKAPGVAALAQRQLEDAVGRVVAGLGVGGWRGAQGIATLAAGPDDELPNAPGGINGPRGRLGCEPLV